jgi:hypothetical protein
MVQGPGKGRKPIRAEFVMSAKSRYNERWCAI